MSGLDDWLKKLFSFRFTLFYNKFKSFMLYTFRIQFALFSTENKVEDLYDVYNLIVCHLSPWKHFENSQSSR